MPSSSSDREGQAMIYQVTVSDLTYFKSLLLHRWERV